LIEQAYILRYPWEARETEYIDSVVDSYDNDVLGIREVLAGVEGGVGVA
jgi:hypothetical protein